MHCCVCIDTSVEVRPVLIGDHDVAVLFNELNVIVTSGDMYTCEECANKLAAVCRDSVFTTWVGFPCDECSQLAAFNDPIDGLPTGLVCDKCNGYQGENSFYVDTDRGVWLCEPCFDKDHHDHPQRQLQSILDRLAKL